MGKHYIDIAEYENDDYPFQAFVGGRGDGKTYSSLRHGVNMFEESMSRFIWMRRTAQEMELLFDNSKGQEGANPFKPINEDYDRDYGFIHLNKNIGGIYHREFCEHKFVPYGDCAGYAVALSTIASIRGMDLSDADRLFYDEFIPERHVRAIKFEGDAFLNAIETIARNRELKGKKPLKVFLLANSNNIYNAIFVSLGIVGQVEKMINRGQSDAYFKERGLAVHLLKSDKKFVEEKSQTALYRLTKGTSYYDMALNNKFAYNDFSLIGYRDIKGYRPVCHCNDMFFWEKKGTKEYYITYNNSRCQNFDVKTVHDRKRFVSGIGKLILPSFIRGNCYFETYELKERFLELMNIK